VPAQELLRVEPAPAGPNERRAVGEGPGVLRISVDAVGAGGQQRASAVARRELRSRAERELLASAADADAGEMTDRRLSSREEDIRGGSAESRREFAPRPSRLAGEGPALDSRPKAAGPRDAGRGLETPSVVSEEDRAVARLPAAHGRTRADDSKIRPRHIGKHERQDARSRGVREPSSFHERKGGSQPIDSFDVPPSFHRVTNSLPFGCKRHAGPGKAEERGGSPRDEREDEVALFKAAEKPERRFRSAEAGPVRVRMRRKSDERTNRSQDGRSVRNDDERLAQETARNPRGHPGGGLSRGENSDPAPAAVDPLRPKIFGDELLGIDRGERRFPEVGQQPPGIHVRIFSDPEASLPGFRFERFADNDVVTRLRPLLLLILALAASCAPAERHHSVVRLAEPAEANGVRTLGRSFVRRRGGIFEARFAGQPYERGYARGRLVYDQIAAAEKDLDSLLVQMVPSPLKRWAMRQLLGWTMRRSEKWIGPEHEAEIAGMTDAEFPDPLPGGWSPYARELALHALHDFSQRFTDTMPLSGACSGFAAGPGATADGHVYLARNFDFEAGPRFDREKIVAAVVPDSGHAFLSVTFGGLTGVVSGLNDAGLSVSLQALTGGPTAGSGGPSSLLVADVLERDATVEQAVERIRAARVLVSDIYLLADASGALAVVEKTPRATGVRKGGDWVSATNLAETPEIARIVGPPPAFSTSPYRQRRLDELLAARAGRLDAAAAVEILRDRKGLGDAPLGLGNLNGIDALIACHSVVFDLTNRRAYVAASPHTLGAYAVFDLSLLAGANPDDPRFAALDALSVPADPLLTSGEYARYRQARELNRRARAELRSGFAANSERDANAALSLAPDFLEALVCRGQARSRQGKDAADLEVALRLSPGPPDFAAQIERARQDLRSGPLVGFPLSLEDLLEENQRP
jgi:isopenicillin-N N-acyltransferase like protein